MLFDMAKEGTHVHSESIMQLRPRETRTLTHYIVLSTTPNEAKKYEVLADYADDDSRRMSIISMMSFVGDLQLKLEHTYAVALPLMIS